ncbi:Hypothetical predicted protein, partial [Mytilus galloprovincialis]
MNNSSPLSVIDTVMIIRKVTVFEVVYVSNVNHMMSCFKYKEILDFIGKVISVVTLPVVVEVEAIDVELLVEVVSVVEDELFVGWDSRGSRATNSTTYTATSTTTAGTTTTTSSTTIPITSTTTTPTSTTTLTMRFCSYELVQKMAFTYLQVVSLFLTKQPKDFDDYPIWNAYNSLLRK